MESTLFLFLSSINKSCYIQGGGLLSMVVSPINVMLTINVTKVSHECNTHYKCNKLLTINVIEL